MRRITAPFNAQSSAAEVIAGVDLTGKRAVVTGGASGIGLETADPGDGGSGVAPYALDQNQADRLWDETTRLLHR